MLARRGKLCADAAPVRARIVAAKKKFFFIFPLLRERDCTCGAKFNLLDLKEFGVLSDWQNFSASGSKAPLKQVSSRCL
jgi:hypothetical protein